jgi:tetratricopeptide (TPR) repeat protein
VFGSFVLLGELGRGGMGAVYRAWHQRLRRVVALKTLLPGAEVGEGAIKRFHREGEAVARLRHPNIVAVHEVGEVDGRHYIVMDFIDGSTLEHRLIPSKKEPRGEKLSLTQALEVLSAVASAVQYAHEQGVIHRDLKPANVMLDGKDHPYVMDFGLARLSGDRTRLTKTGTGMGTPAYMPPEQAGDGVTSIDERSDVYSLGATLYHVLTGRPPFQGATPINVIANLLTKDPVPPSSLNRRVAGDLETICLKCLEKEKEKRYASAAEVARDLERYLVGEPIAARPIGSVERLLRRAKRNMAATALVAVAAFGVAAGGAFAIYHQRVEAALARGEEERTALETERRTEIAGEIARARDGSLTREGGGALDDAVRKLASFREPYTVELLGAALDDLAKRRKPGALADADRDVSTLACRVLALLGDKGAVKPLGDYLAVEKDEVLAIEPGVALCQLREVGGAEAERLVREAGVRFGYNGPFWGKVSRLLGRTGAESKLGEETVVGYNERGTVRRDKGDLDGAIADYTKAIELEPRFAKSWCNRATSRDLKGDLDGAIADYSRALELDPRLANAWGGRGETRRVKGDLEGSLADGTRAIELDPGSCGHWRNRGITRADLGDQDGAIADATQAIKVEPRDDKAWSNRGNARARKGDLDGAIADHTHAIELDPRNAVPWICRGGDRFQKGDLDGSIEDLSRAVELDSRSAMAWERRGIAREAKGDLDGVVSDCTRAIELDRRSYLAWFYRAGARNTKGDGDGAIADATAAIDVDQRRPAAWALRGLVRAKNGDRPGAIADYERFLELAPDDPKAVVVREQLASLRGPAADSPEAVTWTNRGVALREKGDLDGAIAAYGKALELDPRCVPAWTNRGVARFGKSDVDGAIEDFTHALELDPRHVPALGARGLARLLKRDRTGAREDIGRFLELAPDHPQAPMLRKKLAEVDSSR